MKKILFAMMVKTLNKKNSAASRETALIEMRNTIVRMHDDNMWDAWLTNCLKGKNLYDFVNDPEGFEEVCKAFAQLTM